ncbi:hypothetical protein WJX77_006795 [Trebouxia sp. C0004]
MYSEGRLTRSRARSQGIEPVEQLPCMSTKGRTTSKKPGRAAFLDVTNEGNQPLCSEDSSGSVKNLSTEFEPAEVLTESDRAGGSETLAVVPESPTKVLDDEDLSSLGAMLLNYERQSPDLANLVCTAVEVSIPEGKLPKMTGLGEEAAALSIEHPAYSGEVAASLPPDQSPCHLQGSVTMLNSFGNDGGITSMSTPQAFHMPMDIKAESPASNHQTPGHMLKASDAAGSAGDGVLQHGMGTNDLPVSALKSSPREEEEMADTESLPPASPEVDIMSRKDGASAALAGTSLTPMAKFEGVISTQATETPSSPQVPATVVAKLPDAGHIIAEGLTPTPTKSTPKSTPATAAGAAAPSALKQITPESGEPRPDISAVVGVLDSVYYSDSDMGSPAAGEAAGLSATSRGKKLMTLNETPSQSVNIVGPVYFSKPDSPAKEEPDSKPANQTAAPTEPSFLVQPAPGAGSTQSQTSAQVTGDTDLTDSAASAMLGTSVGLAGMTDYVSCPESEAASPAPSASAWLLHQEKAGMPESNTREDWDDRWEMDFEARTAPRNTYAANVPASNLESKIHASPSYDPRSLRQLRQEVATKLAKAAAVKLKAENFAAAPMPVPAGLYDYESQSDTGMSPGPFKESHQEYIKEDDDLCNALGFLDIQSASKSKEPLRGLPVPQGMHIRFDDDGQAMPSPGAGQTRLRGVPAPRSSHIRFD